MTEGPQDHYKIESWKKIALVAFFLIVAGALVYIAFFSGGSAPFTGGFSITGKFSEGSSPDSPLNITGEIDAPERFSFEDDLSEVRINISGESGSILGDQVVNLSKGDNLVLENYQGKLAFGIGIANISGDSSKAGVNGIQISPSSGGRQDIESRSLSFGQMNLNDVNIGSLEYNTSGKIESEDNLFNLENEKIRIEKFSGDLEFKGDKLNLDGVAESIDIKGKSDISISN